MISCKKEKKPPLSNFSPSLDTTKEASINVLGMYGNFEALEQVFANFNEFYPNISLNYEYTENVHDAALNRCSSGGDVDITFIHTMKFDELYKDIADKYFVDFNKVNIDLSNINKTCLDVACINGEQKFIPMYLQVNGILVNKSILKKYGFSIPKNRIELEQICDRFLERGITPIYTSSAYAGGFFFNYLIAEIENSPNKNEIIADLNSGNDTFKVFEAPLQYLKYFEEKGYFNYDGSKLKNQYDALIMRFLEGDTPFVLGSSDTMSGTRKREAKSEHFKKNPFEYTFIPAPTGENGRQAAYQISLLFSLCNTSKNLDYATEFMRYLVSEEGLSTMTEIKGMISVYQKTGDLRIKDFENLTPEETYYLCSDEISSKAADALYWTIHNKEFPYRTAQESSDLFKKSMAKNKY